MDSFSLTHLYFSLTMKQIRKIGIEAQLHKLVPVIQVFSVMLELCISRSGQQSEEGERDLLKLLKD